LVNLKDSVDTDDIITVLRIANLYYTDVLKVLYPILSDKHHSQLKVLDVDKTTSQDGCADTILVSDKCLSKINSNFEPLHLFNVLNYREPTPRISYSYITTIPCIHSPLKLRDFLQKAFNASADVNTYIQYTTAVSGLYVFKYFTHKAMLKLPKGSLLVIFKNDTYFNIFELTVTYWDSAHEGLGGYYTFTLRIHMTCIDINTIPVFGVQLSCSIKTDTTNTEIDTYTTYDLEHAESLSEEQIINSSLNGFIFFTLYPQEKTSKVIESPLQEKFLSNQKIFFFPTENCALFFILYIVYKFFLDMFNVDIKKLGSSIKDGVRKITECET